MVMKMGICKLTRVLHRTLPLAGLTFGLPSPCLSQEVTEIWEDGRNFEIEVTEGGSRVLERFDVPVFNERLGEFLIGYVSCESSIVLDIAYNEYLSDANIEQLIEVGLDITGRFISLGWFNEFWAPDETSAVFYGIPCNGFKCLANIDTVRLREESDFPLYGPIFEPVNTKEPLNGFTVTYETYSSLHPAVELLSAIFKVTVAAEYVFSYKPFTVHEYIVAALIEAQADGGEASDIAESAYSEIIGLREFGAGTSSENLNLRDAEYYLRGYRGAAAIREFKGINYGNLVNEIGDRGGLVTTGIYNGIKAIKNGLLGLNISGEDELPASPVGGAEANLEGYFRGIRGDSVDELIMDLQEREPDPVEPSDPSNDPNMGIAPLASTDFEVDGSPVTTDVYFVAGEEGMALSYFSRQAPEARQGGIQQLEVRSRSRGVSGDTESLSTAIGTEIVAWSIIGGRIAGIEIPSEYFQLYNGLYLETRDAIVEIEQPQTGAYTVDFTTITAAGVDTFMLGGERNNSRVLDVPPIGLRFVDGGEIVLTSSRQSETSSQTWGGYPLANAAMDVNTGDFLGWINVSHGDFVWSYSMDGWIYCPESSVGEGGAWVYVPRQGPAVNY